MNNTFTVTGLGLKVDKVMIMPGSTLSLNQPAPSHWSAFGDPAVAPKEMVVASPSPDDVTLDAIMDMDRDALVDYLNANDVKFDARLGEDKLRELAVDDLSLDD